MESKYSSNSRTISTNYFYTDLSDPTSTSQTTFRGFPALTRQEITGDTISKISYRYYHKSTTFPANTITCERFLNDGTTITDSLLVNSHGMASTVINADGTTQPYYITYDYSGVARTKVGEYTLEVENSNYLRANKNNNIAIDYQYTYINNLIGLQQFGICGSPYYWASDAFGGQSYNLLSKVVVHNPGESPDNYEFSYSFDLYGFVSKEIITLNDQPYLTNTYTYTKGVVVQ